MKKRISTLFCIFGTSLLMAGSALAQTQSQPMPTQPAPSTQTTTSPTPSTTPSSSAATGNSATYNTSQGQVTINSTVPTTQPAMSPPSFEQLANGKKYITKDDANAYPPLANDFLYASNNGSRISKAQYEHWLKDLR
ncbi:hypothetical protein [Dyella acidisoli]|uniref:Uncharacterized protein n=1 Tax=Dyella acidisoli TaxID=1867834 RepID=A0ABQ5XR79_9GAMM|nr:hypothetical protein [Dyella acidisoli]GLQ94255.1 hypothetical protein GCM10007901_32060 [Dyella acidisoli]